MPNSLSISASVRQPYVTVTGKGFWTPASLEQHYRRLDRDLRAMRARAGSARVLVDLSEAAVQTAETAAVMQRWTASIYRETDQVAVICATQLLAMQVRRQAQIRNLKTFTGKQEAIAWLLDDGQAAVPRSA